MNAEALAFDAMQSAAAHCHHPWFSQTHSLQQGFGKGFAQDTGFGKGNAKGFGKGTLRLWKRYPKALEKATHACIEPSWPKMGRLDVLLTEICEEHIIL